MLSSVRRLSKSTLGTIIMALFLLAIVASFALADIQNVGAGNFGTNSGTLAKVGGAQVTERDLSAAMQRRLNEVRQQNPEADYSSLAGDFDQIVEALIQDRALHAFAEKNGIHISKRLVDAEIAKIPATRGLDGKFSQAAYAQFLQQQRLTDAELRQLITASLIQRMLLAPAAANARVPVGIATPYASMLLEARDAEAATVPAAAFAAGIADPSPADIQRFYAENQGRYMVPEQRVLTIARIGTEQVANVTATEQEIAAYYRANQATYGGKAVRVISQVIAPNQNAANAVAARARSSGDLGPQKIVVGEQTREQFARLAGDRVAAAAFSAAEGAIVGPVQSDLGWHVVKIDEVRNEAGRPLAAVRGEIADRLTAEKRKNALTDLITRVEDSIAEGASVADAVRGTGITIIRTPPITGGGVARSQPGFKLPAELAPVLETGFELGEDEDPVVETLPGEAGFALVGVEQVIQAAPAPLASIRDQVAADWKAKQARDRARAVATAIAAKVSKGMSVEAAVAEAGNPRIKTEKMSMRRIQLAQLGGNVPAPVAMVFSLAEGRSRMVADPQGRGFVVVKVTKITPGNATLQPGLITRTQSEFRQTAAAEYAEQFTKAVTTEMGVERNESAIAAAKRRITGGGS